MMDLLKEDVDRLLSYNTKMQVSILDRYLGMTAIMLQLGIVSYIVFYVFMIDEGYLAYEQAFGIATASVTGDVLSMSAGSTVARYFSADELVYPPLENGNIFVTTKLDIYEQTRKVCRDPSMPCMTDVNCSIGVGAVCTDGLCEEPSWCSDGPPESYSLDTSLFQIWIRTAIQFIKGVDKKGNSKIFGEGTHTKPILYPQEGWNLLTVRNLLQDVCDPPVRFEEVSELGAAVEVQVGYNCNIKGAIEDCHHEVRARRVDALFDEDDIGFRFAYPEYTGQKTRRLNDVRGIRFYVRTVGAGHFFSTTTTVMMLSTGIALLGFAPVLTDRLMLNVFPRQQKYAARKYERSPDFSELPERPGRGCCGGGEVSDESSDEL